MIEERLDSNGLQITAAPPESAALCDERDDEQPEQDANDDPDAQVFPLEALGVVRWEDYARQARENPRRWIVDGLFPAGSFSLIAGNPKSGKSHLSFTLAAAVAGGRPFLDRNTMAGPVLYYCLQDDPDEFVALMDREDYQSPDIYVVPYVPSDFLHDPGLADDTGVPSQSVFDHIRIAARQIQPRLIVLNMWGSLFPYCDINDYRVVVSYITIMRSMCLQDLPDTAIVALHHTNKTGEGKRHVEPSRILGSQGLFGEAFSAVLTEERNDKYYLMSKNRAGTAIEYTPTLMLETGRIVLSTSTKQAVVSLVRERTAEKKLAKILAALLLMETEYAMEKLGGVPWFGWPDIRERMKISRGSWEPVLMWAVEQRKGLLRNGKGVRRSPFRYRTDGEAAKEIIRRYGGGLAVDDIIELAKMCVADRAEISETVALLAAPAAQGEPGAPVEQQETV